MSQYSNYWRNPGASGCSGFANTRNVGPGRYVPNSGPGQRHNGPQFYPRHGPPRWPNARPTWRMHNKYTQPISSVITQHSPTSSVAGHSKGPHTPPDPPPEDQPSIDNYMPSIKERTYGKSNDYNDYHNYDEKRHQQQRAPPKQFYNNQHRNMRGRRNSHPLPMPPHPMTSFANNRNMNMDNESCDSPQLDTEKNPPSALNSAVQSYLLQVLTAQPPPNLLSTPYNELSSTSLIPYQSMLPAQTPPPLPPTPTRPATPPPPPSDEENWDTPSEASNDATAFKPNSPSQENVRNIEDNVADTQSLALTCNMANEIENRTDTWETIPNMTAPSDDNGDREHDDSEAQKDYNSFKIIIPPRVDGVTHEVDDNVEGNVMKDALNTTHVNSLESALTIDIPTGDIIMGSIANQEDSRLDKLESILKIVTPKKTNPNVENNNADKTDIPYRVTLPHREDSRSQERDGVKENADNPLGKTKSKRKRNSGKSTSKVWPLEVAEKALYVEQELLKEFSKENVLILRFPDPTLSREMVKDFCEDIESVHFQQNSAPRYCFVHLKEGVDVQKSIETLCKIPFGTGFIKAELRNVSVGKPCSAKADNIDPFTLYVGNLSPTVPCKVLKEHFPGASRINIGFAQRMKYTRYAFIQYQNVDAAIAGYRRMFKSEIEGRSLIIRFKRLGTAATIYEETQMHGGLINDDEEHVDTCSTISTSTMPSDMTEDAAITTAECDSCERVASTDTIREPNPAGDCCDEPNVQLQFEQECEISPSINNQTNLETLTDDIGGLKDKSNNVVNIINEINKNSCISQDLVNCNESKGLNHDDLPVSEQPYEEPKECLTYSTTTQTEIGTETIAMTEFEIAANTESTKQANSNSNTVQSLTSDRQQGIVDDTVTCRSTNTVKSEEPPCGIGANERIVYRMPRTSQRLENRTSGVDFKNKCELNEDFEFFSVRQTSVSALDVETERPSSTNSCCSSIEFANACFSDQYLETIEMSKTVQRRRKVNESKDDLSQELLENISRDMNLLTEALKKNMKSTRIKRDLIADHETLLIEDDISMIPPSSMGQRHCHAQSKNFDNTGGSDEDLVPSNALLLRRNTIDTSSREPYRINSPQQVKNEYHEYRTQESGVQNTNGKLKEPKFIPQPTSPRTKSSRKRKSPSSIEDLMDMKPVVSNDDDDDDLVPANCALHLFQKSVSFFDLTLDEEDPIMQLKREAETGDIFSLPKRTDKGKRPRSESRSSDSLNDGHIISRPFRSLENNKQQSNGLKSINEEEDPYSSDDDDVVIITDDISPLTHQNLPMPKSLNSPNQKATLTIKHESNSPTSIEKSFFDKHKRPSQHRDNLDRLFALLNSNSDEES